ncbi:hypothetical protein pb186bvf_019063 [Paramecium bursaria]
MVDYLCSDFKFDFIISFISNLFYDQICILMVQQKVKLSDKNNGLQIYFKHKNLIIKSINLDFQPKKSRKEIEFSSDQLRKKEQLNTQAVCQNVKLIIKKLKLTNNIEIHIHNLNAVEYQQQSQSKIFKN